MSFMDSVNEYNYEVPIVNLDDNNVTIHSIPNAKKLTNINEEQDNCTIMGFNSKLNRIQHGSNNRKIDPIVIDEDSDKEDCTIINDQETEATHKNLPKSFKEISTLTHYSSYRNEKHINIITTVQEKSQEISSNAKLNKQSTDLVDENSNEAIVIEEDSEKDNDCAIIDVIQSNVVSTVNKVVKNAPTQYKNADIVEEVCRRDKGLAELIEKCFEMENSEGMTRIVHRTLVPIYTDTSAEFKKSEIFQRFLTKTIIKLEKEPRIKFTHIKNLCEFMKEGKIFEGKNRAQLTTLKKSLNGKFSKRKLKSSNSKTAKKKKKMDIINLDDVSDDDAVTNVYMPINGSDIQRNDSPFKGSDTQTQENKMGIEVIEIEKENERSQAIEKSSAHIYSVYKNQVESNSSQAKDIDIYKNIEITQEDTDLTDCESIKNNENDGCKDNNGEKDDDIILIDEENDNSNKENITNVHKNNETRTFPTNDLCHKNNLGIIKKSTKIMEIDLCNDDEIENVMKDLNPEQAKGTGQPVLLPAACDPMTVAKTQEEELKCKIENIEMKIKLYNGFIQELESKEVDWNIDSEESPYVKSEHYKYLVVTLYKELCRLTGTEAVKRHQVRLKVVQGRPEGPVRCLEEFINSNIDENGNPPFPDMHDVIYCVEKANMECQLGWGKREIEMEARALFIHYGRTVQKKRQKREWRHLMRYVEREDTADPADKDPALQARLQQNAALAMKNEKDLLDMYAAMENSSYPRVPDNEMEMSLQSSESYQETIPLIISNVTSIADVGNRKDGPNVTPNSEDVPRYVSDNENVPNLTPNTENIHRYVANNENVPANVPNSANIKGYVIVPCNESDRSLPKKVSVLYSGNNNVIRPNSEAIQNVNEHTQNINENIETVSRSFNDTVHNKVNIENRTDNVITNNELNKCNNTNTRINSSIDGRNGCINDLLCNPKVVLTPLILTPTVINYPLNIIVNQNISPTMSLTAHETVDVLKKRLEKCSPRISVNTITDACKKSNPSKEKCKYTADDEKLSLTAQETFDVLNKRLEKCSPRISVNNIPYACKQTNPNQEKRKNVVQNTEDNEEPKEESYTKPNSIALKIVQLLNCEDSTDGVDSDDDKGANVGEDDINSNVRMEEVSNGSSGINQDIQTASVQDNEVSTSSHTNNIKTVSNNTRNIDTNSETNRSENCEVENDAGTSKKGEVEVKREPLDIPRMLLELGDNFTVSVIDIEDPFEIIEISDSSESEDEDL